MRLAFLDNAPRRIFGYEYTEAQRRDTSYIASLLCGPVRRSGTEGAPITLHYALHAAGVSNLVALGAGAVVPAVGVIVQLLTKRHLDGMGSLVVVTAVAAIVLSAITRSPRFLLAKDGLLTAVWGVWFLATIRFRRPTAFVMARPLLEGRHAFSAGSWDDLWSSEPQFRHIWRVASALWGVGLLTDAVLWVVMSYTLPIPVLTGLGVLCGRRRSCCCRWCRTSNTTGPAFTGFWAQHGFVPESFVQPEKMRPVGQVAADGAG